MHFWKIEAAGNDFVLFNEADLGKKAQDPGFIKSVCDRHFGIGADGVVIRKKTAKPEWLFLNCDGSKAEFCGNASRAFSNFLLEENPKKKEVSFKTLVGEVTGRRSEKKGWITVEIPITAQSLDVPPEVLRSAQEKIPNFMSASYWLAGVPHLVLQVHLLPDHKSRLKWARLLYDHPQTPSAKWNITWLSKNGQAVTFERGVEDETLACGSGALACFCATEKPSKSKPRTFNFPGGDLMVERAGNQLALSGPARKVFEGEFEE